MRKFPLLLVLFVLSFTLSAAKWVDIHSPLPVPAKIKLVSSTLDRSVVHVSIEGFSLHPVQTPAGEAFFVTVGKATPIQDAGAPDLPKLTLSVIIPDQAAMDVRVVASSYRDYPDISVAPSKGVIMRDQDPASVPFSYGSCYSTDEFYPLSPAGLRDPYIIRDLRGQTLIAYPFRYNPVTRTLRVYSDMDIEIFKTGDHGINPLPGPTVKKKIPQGFLPVYRHQFANLSALSYTPLNEFGNLLVICYGPFMNAMQPYVAWKQAEGYHTEMINRDSVGTTAGSIKSFIADYYNSKGLTHVLLVGDAPQIPTNTGNGLGGPSDNAYGYIVGNDHYADVFVGRFSAETEAQVQTQVQRTLEYEQSPQFLTDDWFTTVIGIGSDQGPGDDNEMDYEHIRNQQTKLLAYHYTWNPELFDGSQGGNDATGNPTPTMVSTEVNNGASLLLYTGHGSNTSWGTSGFSNTNVNQLTNVGKLPFIWSVACVNGNFLAGTCFAEAWLRASQGGQPTGALAFLGSTINQSWNSPMEGQDAMTDILVESDSTNIKRTFAGLSINGCMEMIDAYGTDGANMADTWTIFGDPTIMVRTAVPQTMVVTYDTLLYVGDSAISVTCSVNGARVTATHGGSILATSLVSNNTALLAFPALVAPFDTVRLVVTAYNMLPYQGKAVVRAQPVAAGFSGIPLHISTGNHVNFYNASSANTTVFQWSFPGGTPASSTEENPVVTYQSKGYFDVTLIAGNGVYTDTLLKTAYITVDYPALVEEKPENFSCRIMPNPGTGKFVIDLNTPGHELLELSVNTMTGTTVYSESDVACDNHASIPVDLSAMADGIYLLRVKGNNGILCRKIIISR
ncbi:MAG: C25 family cysteine peptidase [Bacteroidota bacterium]